MTILYSILHFFKTLGIEKALILLFAIAMLAEWIIARAKKRETHQKNDSITNFIIGSISFSFDFVFTLLMLPVWMFLYKHARVLDFNQEMLLVWIVLFVLIDFTEYWFHRLSHEINLLWTAHVVHHQSEYFNLTVGLRTSVFVPLFNVFFYSVFPILGFNPISMLTIIFIQGIYQLLVHTELVGKLGWIDYVLVTPSVHRVHHGKNETYIDKNYGKVFLVWDQLFGTWQRETEKPVFGITTPLQKNKAGYAIFKPAEQLLDLTQQAQSKKDRQVLLFGSPEEVEKWKKKSLDH